MAAVQKTWPGGGDGEGERAGPPRGNPPETNHPGRVGDLVFEPLYRETERWSKSSAA